MVTGSYPAEVRVLVTGSRTWTSPSIIEGALEEIRASLRPWQILIVVHGANRSGADAAADAWAIQHRDAGVLVERHLADWRSHSRTAGMLRNTQMIEPGADLCLAFIRDQSPGASHCAREAERAFIPTRRFQHPADTTQLGAAENAADVAGLDRGQAIQGELFQLPETDKQEWAL